jgi:hypothetical protein
MDCVYSKLIGNSRSTYFIELKETLAGEKCLTITQASKALRADNGHKYRRKSVVIHGKAVTYFVDAVYDIAPMLKRYNKTTNNPHKERRSKNDNLHA